MNTIATITEICNIITSPAFISAGLVLSISLGAALGLVTRA